MALRLLFDLIVLDLDEEEKESPWAPDDDFELDDVASFDDDWGTLLEAAVVASSDACGSGSGGRPFSITIYRYIS